MSNKNQASSVEETELDIDFRHSRKSRGGYLSNVTKLKNDIKWQIDNDAEATYVSENVEKLKEAFDKFTNVNKLVLRETKDTRELNALNSSYQKAAQEYRDLLACFKTWQQSKCNVVDEEPLGATAGSVSHDARSTPTSSSSASSSSDNEVLEQQRGVQVVEEDIPKTNQPIAMHNPDDEVAEIAGNLDACSITSNSERWSASSATSKTKTSGVFTNGEIYTLNDVVIDHISKVMCSDDVMEFTRTYLGFDDSAAQTRSSRSGRQTTKKLLLEWKNQKRHEATVTTLSEAVKRAREDGTVKFDCDKVIEILNEEKMNQLEDRITAVCDQMKVLQLSKKQTDSSIQKLKEKMNQQEDMITAVCEQMKVLQLSKQQTDSSIQKLKETSIRLISKLQAFEAEDAKEKQEILDELAELNAGMKILKCASREVCYGLP